MTTTFDFGNGPVPAHQHPNGGGWVADTAYVADSAYVGPDARVCGDAWVFDNAWVFDDAQVFGNAWVSGNARVYGNAWVSEGILKVDIKQNIMVDILAQTGLVCKEDHVIAYKRVRANLTSEYDSDFQYVVGKWVSDPNAEESNRSCAPGLHVSRVNYFPKEFSDETKLILECKVMLEDIITVQEGKIRCRKLFVERVAF